MKLVEIINEANNLINFELKLKVEKSQLKRYSNQDYLLFCEANQINPNSLGIYFPKIYTAYVQNSKFLLSTIFHEYFGHGLFCEHTKSGQELVKKDKKEGEEYLSGSDIPNCICTTRIGDYEGFALWMEYTLSELFGFINIFNKKRKIMSDQQNNLLDYFLEVEQRYTRFFLTSMLGFPKYYNKFILTQLITRIYDPNEIKFAVLYGSQKPDSDIDIAIVKEGEIRQYNDYCRVFDFSEYTIETFYSNLNNLDLDTIEFMNKGILLLGNKEEFERLKNQLNSTKIDEGIITYNQTQLSELKEYFPKIDNLMLKKRALSYIKTYSQHIHALEEGFIRIRSGKE